MRNENCIAACMQKWYKMQIKFVCLFSVQHCRERTEKNAKNAGIIFKAPRNISSKQFFFYFNMFFTKLI